MFGVSSLPLAALWQKVVLGRWGTAWLFAGLQKWLVCFLGQSASRARGVFIVMQEGETPRKRKKRGFWEGALGFFLFDVGASGWDFLRFYNAPM